MQTKAKFTGKDGSAGFRNGSIYVFDFTCYAKSNIIIEETPGVTIEYGSLRAFLNNWEVIR